MRKRSWFPHLISRLCLSDVLFPGHCLGVGSSRVQTQGENQEHHVVTEPAPPSPPLDACDSGAIPPPTRQVLRGSQAILWRPHSLSTAPRVRGTSRPREYTARAMRRVSTRSPSTIPARMPGLTAEQLHSGMDGAWG